MRSVLLRSVLLRSYFHSLPSTNENKLSSIWQLYRRHRKLSKWQLPVPPVTIKLSNWRSFVVFCALHRQGDISATPACWRTSPHPLQWRHNERDGVSNYQPHDCLLKRLFRHRSKKTSKLRVTGLLWGEFTGDRWIPRTKRPVTRKMFPFDNVIMLYLLSHTYRV